MTSLLSPDQQRAIVNFALTKYGPLIQRGITGLAAVTVTYLTHKIPGLAPYIDVQMVTFIVWIIIDSLVSSIPSSIIKDYATQIQTALNTTGANLPVDGSALSKTTAAVNNLVATVKSEDKPDSK